MTSRRNLKKRVRALQKETGESYTSALARLLGASAPSGTVRVRTHPDRSRILAEFDTTRRIVFRTDAMQHVATRRNEVYLVDGKQKLLMDLYSPPNLPPGTRRPAVLFVHGGPIPVDMAPPKNWGVFESYASLAAASGLVGVAFNHRLHAPTDYPRSVNDVAAAVGHLRAHAEELGVDGDRIALWYFSGGGPLMSWVLRERPAFVRCVVGFYPVLDLRPFMPPETPKEVLETVRQLSPAALLGEKTAGLPIFIARAGQDSAPINASIDLFVREALASNAQLDFANHAQGRHSFDILDDDERSKELIARGIEFVRTHLK